MRSFCLYVLLGLTFAVSGGSPADHPVILDTLVSDSIQDWFGDRIVPVGDQNADGYDDFLVRANPFKLFLCLGGYLSPDSLRIKLDDSAGIFVNNFGLVNNDEFPDFGSLRWVPTGRLRIAVWYGGMPLGDGYDVFLGDDTLWPGQSRPIYTTDINGNGYGEFIAAPYDHTIFPALTFYETGPVFDSTPDFQLQFPPDLQSFHIHMGDAVRSLDVNGDGFDDLITNVRWNDLDSLKGQVLIYWGGPTFDTNPDARIRRRGPYDPAYVYWGMLIEETGDLNADGWDDFAVGYRSGTEDMLRPIFFCGPDFDTVPDVLLTDGSEKLRMAGDVNHDGWDDLITGATTSFGWGYAYIYLGGPDFDSIPDVVIDPTDVISGYYSYFAHEVAGIGDVNGDGIDDFAVGVCRGAPWQVLIFSGWSGATDVDLDHDPTMPSDFRLDQNYPNPFNASTTISFQLPVRADTRLSIYNVLGQQIVTVIDRELSAGSYRLTWDGRNGSGQPVSSGVYFYKLRAGDLDKTRKMLLVK